MSRMHKSLADASTQIGLQQWSPPTPIPRAGQRYTLNHLTGSSDSAIIAQQAIEHRQHFSIMIVVTASATDATRLFDEISVFAPQLKVRLLPDWEILPYDAFSPHQDLVSHWLVNTKTDGELGIESVGR